MTLEFYMMTAAALLFFFALMKQGEKLRNERRIRTNLDVGTGTILERLGAERRAHYTTLRELGDAQEQLGYVSAAQVDGQTRLNAMGHLLEQMTSQRDELLAGYIFDGHELETVFEDMEDAEDFLAKRKRAIEGLRRVMTMDLGGPEWDDDHVTQDLDSQLLKITDIDDEEMNEPFPHCTAADTTKARDELMQGFDDKETK